MRHALIALSILLGTATPAMAEVSVGVSIAIPGVSIGINQPAYPELVPVPGYPVYYAPHAQANYFFYDGLYWVYQDDRWYASTWYDGPWDLVHPDDVPLFVLRVPVRYYVYPPVYFYGWYLDAPPRWDHHWGHRWAQHRHGWDHWDRRVVYAPAPLPVYQRHYAGDRYPRRDYQRVIRHEHYHYQSRDHVVRRHEQQQSAPRPQVHARPAVQHSPAQQRPDSPREQRPQREREDVRRTEPLQVLPPQRSPAVQEQRQPPRQEPERRAQAPVQPAPQAAAPVVPAPQQAPRQREEAPRDMPRPAPAQVAPQQREPAVQEPRAQRQEQAPRAQQAPRPPQVREREAQDRGDRQPRGNAERRQGQERGGDRGPGRG